MFRYEMKKILFYRRSLWLILGLVCLELLSTLLFTKPYDAQLERNRQVYESYLSAVEGPLTHETGIIWRRKWSGWTKTTRLWKI